MLNCALAAQEAIRRLGFEGIMITREVLFDVGRDVGIEVWELVPRDDDLFEADEVFLTCTTRELLPIVTVDDRTIGSGRPGPVTGRMLKEFRRHAAFGDSPSSWDVASSRTSLSRD